VALSDETCFDRPAFLDLRTKLLEAALAYYQDFIEQHGDDPSTQAQLEDARSRVAHILPRRVRQIQLRLLDVLAFNLPEVVAELRLTPAQRSELVRRFHEERVACGEEILRNLRRDNTLEDLLKMFLEAYPRARDRALESLSVEQQARWQELTGEPIRWPVHSLLARGGPTWRGWSITFSRRPVR
jgi:hypothetical protein